MSDDAELTMIIYSDLLLEEKNVLKEMEKSIIDLLLMNSLSGRLIWTYKLINNERFVQLVLGDNTKSKVLLELASNELDTISSDILLSRLDNNIRQG